MFYTIAWEKGTVSMIDQRRLPLEEHYVRCATSEEVARAIETMVIRGAPAIGVAAAMGVALGARALEAASPEAFLVGLEKVIERLAATRPTAVNLFWALARMRAAAERAVAGGIEAARAELARESQAILDEDVAANRAMGRFGAELISDGESILTHCNAGALATGGYGTALGVLRAAHEAGKKIHVFVDETRPFLQGARLTAWELVQLGIPATLITDNMAGHLMRLGHIQRAITGADRIAANGDAANKIGTYSVAVLAREHGIPFHVAAPVSTIDFDLADGSRIPIEERSADEVTHCGGRRVAPEGIAVRNPAFDVTPHRLIRSIITERGVLEPPFEAGIAALRRRG